MKLVFIDDGPIYYDEHGNYYEYAFHGLYERYRYLADQITFMIRTAPLTQKTGGTLVPQEIHVIDIPNYKNPRLYLKNRKKAKIIIENEIKRTDIAILRGSSGAHLALPIVKKYNIPYIYECVACDWDKYWNYSLLGKCIAPIMFFRAKRAVWKSPYVYYVTQKFLQKRYPTKGKSIGCSNVVIETEDKKVLLKRLEKIASMKEKEKIVLGTAAAVDVKYKGQEDVIKTLKLLEKKGIYAEYHIAGSNRTNSTYLMDMASKLGVKDKVIYCGSLSSDEMADFYDSLDIYIQPSKQEGLPRSVIEAMSRGIPCLASNIAGNFELLNSLFLFHKGRPKEIEKAINRILKYNLQKISINNYKKANKEYNAKILSKRRKNFYDLFLNELNNNT